MNWLIDTPIAHRGLHNKNGAPENSFKAFERAIENNLPIELDVKRTADGKLIVFHDEDYLRMTGNEDLVSSAYWDKVKNFKLADSNLSIPLFTELLEFVDGRVPLLIEIKNFNKPGEFEKQLIQELKHYKGDFAIQSFNPLSVRWLRINAPDVLRGQIASRFRDDQIPVHYKYLLKNLAFNISTKPHFINYKIDDLPYLPIGIYRKTGIPLLGWTVRTEAQIKKASAICDNFVFEDLEPSQIVK